MILGQDFLKKLAVTVSITISIVLFGGPVVAAAPQENPDTAAVIFSGVSLFQLYSGTLDSVLAKNQQSIMADIQVSYFANVPPAIEDSYNNFLSSAGNLCDLILGLDVSVSDTKLLLQQSGFAEAAPLNTEAFNNLAIAEENLDSIKQAVSIAGNQFKISAASSDSSISIAYAAVQADINRLNDLLDLYRSILQEHQTEITKRSLILSSDITINIKQSEAYVGDAVDVDGTLSVKGQPLANRLIEILIDGSRYLTLTTDTSGHYLGSLHVPYLYVSAIQIQSLYFPQTGDIGNYDLALSPSVNLKVLFYSVVLMLQTGPNAYPGRDISLTGQFQYGSNPAADIRHIEISLDNTPVSESDVSAVFTRKISLPAVTSVGDHLITVSAVPDGRYGPVVANINLTVAKPIPVVLTVNTPFVVFVPGSFDVRGTLTSAIGPVPQADITIMFGGRNVTAVSANDGSFSAVISSKMGFGLFGSQSMQITAAAVAPWQTVAVASQNVFTVYVVGCGVFFLILVFLGIILPRRFQFRIKLRAKTRLPQATTAAPAAVPIIADVVSQKAIGGEANTPADRLFYWYRFVIHLVQRVSGLHLKPNQTLREYINNTDRATGAAATVLLEFTRVVEKVLYSPHRITEEEIKNGEQLARKIQGSIGK